MITSPASASQQHAKLSMWVANAKREPGGAVAELFFLVSGRGWCGAGVSRRCFGGASAVARRLVVSRFRFTEIDPSLELLIIRLGNY